LKQPDSSRAPIVVERRSMLRACGAFALSCAAAKVLADENETAATGDTGAPPREGDLLAFAYGDRAGQAIGAADLTVGDKQTLAYPMDASTKRVRDGTRLNQLVVVRLPTEGLAAETLARSADGVVAYSGVCTHTGCDVTDWLAPLKHFKCPCHESEFDPSDAARVMAGPAPWQLAALPLKIVDGKLAVAGSFVGEVGFAQPGLQPFGN
jgi:Rieske Fe-S protein